MGSYTTNFNLYKPDTNETGWGDKINQNFEIIDDELTANKILEKLKTVDGSGSGLDADTIDGKHADELGGGAGFEKIAEIKVNSDCTYVEFINLDGNSDWFYVLFFTTKNPFSYNVGYQLIVNDDGTNANYYLQKLDISNGNISAGRLNTMDTIVAYGNENVFCKIIMTKDVNGYFRAFVNSHQGNCENVKMRIAAYCYKIAIENIEKLRICSSVNNAIIAGSKFILFKARK